MPIFAPLFVAPPAGPQIFNQSIAAFKARRAFTVDIALDALLNKNMTARQYRLSYLAPQKVLLMKLVGGKPNLVFWLNGSDFLAYDPSAREMIRRKGPRTGPIINRLANSVGGLEDPVSAQLAPETMAAFLAPFQNLNGWTTTTRPNRVVLSRRSSLNGQRNTTQFEFDTRTKLLTKALLIGPASKLQWVFTYGTPPRSLSYNPPAGTKLVKSFVEHTTIDASDAKARNLVDQSLRAYSRISNIAFAVNGSTGSATAWMSGTSFREKQPTLEWTYHQGVFTLRDFAKRRSYRGKCKPSAVTTYLRLLRRPMDPVLQAMLMKRNPIRNWFFKGTKVSSRGAVSIKGVMADAVELRSPLLEVSLLLRSDNHLVSSVSSRTKDANGTVISKSNREFTYWAVNGGLPAKTFSIPASNPLPLTRIGK